jgi:hypothetical protein
MSIERCNVLENTLIMSTAYDGIYSFSTKDGGSSRRILIVYGFRMPPTLFNDVIYTMGSDKTVYAVSLETLDVKGYVQLEPSPVLGSPLEDFKVFLYKNGIIFKAENKIVFYAPK